MQERETEIDKPSETETDREGDRERERKRETDLWKKVKIDKSRREKKLYK